MNPTPYLLQEEDHLPLQVKGAATELKKPKKLKKLKKLKKRKSPEVQPARLGTGAPALKQSGRHIGCCPLFNNNMRKTTGSSSSSSSSPSSSSSSASSSIEEEDAVHLIIRHCKKNHLDRIIIREGEQPLWRPDCLSAGAPVPSLAGWTSGLFRFFRFFRFFSFFSFSHFHLLWNQIKKYDMFR